MGFGEDGKRRLFSSEINKLCMFDLGEDLRNTKCIDYTDFHGFAATSNMLC